MPRKRTYHVVERGRRGPGGHITWRVEGEFSDWLYASEVCAQIHRAGDVFRRREIGTTRAIPTTPGEAAWHVARLRHREARIRANPLLLDVFNKD